MSTGRRSELQGAVLGRRRQTGAGRSGGPDQDRYGAHPNTDRAPEDGGATKREQDPRILGPWAGGSGTAEGPGTHLAVLVTKSSTECLLFSSPKRVTPLECTVEKEKQQRYHVEKEKQQRYPIGYPVATEVPHQRYPVEGGKKPAEVPQRVPCCNRGTLPVEKEKSYTFLRGALPEVSC